MTLSIGGLPWSLRRKLPFFAAIPAILLAGTLVLAERPHVVILGPSADHAAVVRLRGELVMLGIDVDVLVHAKATADLEALARRLGAAAALRIETAPPAIVLWVDPAVASGAPGEVRVGGPAEERDPALLALRAVEILHARLVKVPPWAPPQQGGTAAAAPAQDAGASMPSPAVDAGTPGVVAEAGAPAASSAPAPDAAAPRARAERTRPVGFSAGPALLLSPGGVPAALEIRIGAEWDPIPRVGIEATAFVPATAGTVMASAGAIALRTFGIGGGVRGVFTDPAAPFSVALGLGLDALLLSFSGKAAAPWIAESGSRWAPAPYLSATAAYRLHPVVSVRLDVVAAIVRPEPVLRIAGHDAASFGQPAMLPSLGVEVRP